MAHRSAVCNMFARACVARVFTFCLNTEQLNGASLLQTNIFWRRQVARAQKALLPFSEEGEKVNEMRSDDAEV